MPVLPTSTSDFLTRIKNDLSVGKDTATPGSGNIRAAALNYLRAQDMASVLGLLQDALSNPLAIGALTFTGIAIADEEVVIGSQTYIWKAAPAAANEVDIGVDAPTCVANLVAAIMDSGTPGVEYGTGTVAHPDVTAVDGTGDVVDVISKVGGTAGNAIATTTDLTNASWGAATLTGGAAAITLTATGNGTVNTFVEGASTFAANAHVGDKFTFDAATTTTALQGLTFTVASNTTTTLTFAETLPGATVTGDDGTLASGAMDAAISELREGQGLADAPRGSVYGEARTVTDALVRLVAKLNGTVAERNIGRPGLETAAGSSTTVIVLKTAGVNYRIDELVGTKMTIAGAARKVLRNDENTATVGAAYASAPAADTAVAITVPADDAHPSFPQLGVHPGAQPGENIFLGDLIGQVETLVVAFVLPT